MCVCPCRTVNKHVSLGFMCKFEWSSDLPYIAELMLAVCDVNRAPLLNVTKVIARLVNIVLMTAKRRALG